MFDLFSCEKLPQRVIDLFDAVDRLAAGGADAFSLKVADIAAAAGMGKGTVYEYFSSKEELVCAAFIYRIRLHCENTLREIDSVDSFEEKCTVAFACLEKTLRSHYFLNSSIGSCPLDKLQTEEFQSHRRQVMQVSKQQMHHAVTSLYECGVREGILAGGIEEDKVMFVFLSALLSLTASLAEDSSNAESKKQYALDMVVSTLSRK